MKDPEQEVFDFSETKDSEILTAAKDFAKTSWYLSEEGEFPPVIFVDGSEGVVGYAAYVESEPGSPPRGLALDEIFEILEDSEAHHCAFIGAGYYDKSKEDFDLSKVSVQLIGPLEEDHFVAQKMTYPGGLKDLGPWHKAEMCFNGSFLKRVRLALQAN